MSQTLDKIKLPLAELARRYPDMEEPELNLLFDKRLELVSQSWFLSVGFVVGLLSPVVLLGINLSLQPISINSLYAIFAVLVFELVLLLGLVSIYQKGSLSRNQETHLQDYLEARKIIRSRTKP